MDRSCGVQFFHFEQTNSKVLITPAGAEVDQPPAPQALPRVVKNIVGTFVFGLIFVFLLNQSRDRSVHVILPFQNLFSKNMILIFV